MLHVGIDCRPLQEGAAGVRTYLRGLLREFARFSNLQVTCFCSRALPAVELGISSPHVTLVNVAGRWVNNWFWTEWQLPRAVMKSNSEWERSAQRPRVREAGGARTRPIDLFHFPAYTASSRLSCRTVVSVHDVSYAAHPEWYPNRSGRVRQRFYRVSAEEADAVITMSQFSKSEIMRVYSVAEEDIYPIYLASGLQDVKPAPRWDRPEKLSRYLLHVGDLHRRRNLVTALEAFHRAEPDPDLDFVMVGKDLGGRAEIEERAGALGILPRLHFLQDLPVDQMPHYYQNAVALIYPSLYEGFGLPLLEAMQWQCPVVASRVASIPEVAGDGAWLVDPLNPDEIAEGIRAILRQPETRQRFIEKGLKRAALFTWRKTAEQTAEVYRQVCGGE
ncbi:MAG TPA: glycosyltransferase family 1 protein [Acidobacteriota bacterium]|jgi:glycosyltransferase involved in cell wall biosynthesis